MVNAMVCGPAQLAPAIPRTSTLVGRSVAAALRNGRLLSASHGVDRHLIDRRCAVYITAVIVTQP